MTFRSLKGFSDILPAEVAQWQRVESIARDVAADFNYREIRTPVLESSDVYHRGVGESSDIVRKETYTFADRDGESVTLRPEGTAGVARAVIEAGLLNDAGARVKVYYLASNFRHERPQKGRLRQHHQFGAEAFGVAAPEQDFECILLQLSFYRRCGLQDLSLHVNSLGDRESKERYRSALVEYFKPLAETLSEDSRRRLEQNPLRILDSKDPRDAAAIAAAPGAGDSLSESSRNHFRQTLHLLDLASVEYVVDPTLVRGFDYYTETLWEVTAGGLGSQNAIGGGGRYDNLVSDLGGRPTPGVGFGSGIERLLIALSAQKASPLVEDSSLVFLVAHGSAAVEHNHLLADELRQRGVAVDIDLSGRSVKAQLKMADREKARLCVIVGDDELADKTIVLKNFSTGEQWKVNRNVAAEQVLTELQKLTPLG